MMKSESIFLEKEQVWEDLGEGVFRQILGYDKNIMMVKVKFEKGAAGNMHLHSHVQTSYVVAGKFEVIIDEKKKIIEAGDSFFVEPELIHGVVCLEAGILLDVFSPMRGDFLTR